jgi:hypothetical protein
MGGDDLERLTFKHVLDEDAAFNDLLVDLKLHVVRTHKKNHVVEGGEIMAVDAGRKVLGSVLRNRGCEFTPANSRW